MSANPTYAFTNLPTPRIFSDPQTEKAYRRYVKKWNACEQCFIEKHTYQKVHARGYIEADICFIGLNPDISETTIGNPFVGSKETLLHTCLCNIELPRWALLHFIACTPETGESTHTLTQEPFFNCTARINELLHIIRPKKLVALGKPPFSRLKKESYFQTENPQTLALSDPNTLPTLDTPTQTLVIKQFRNRLKTFLAL